jgi:sugar phosphate isomerase/epimerase
MLQIGLNPYGLTYTLGLQGWGTSRVNPHGTGLEGFLSMARGIGARCAELDWRWLTQFEDGALRRLGERCRADGMTVILSAWLMQQPGETLDTPIRLASALGASLLRLHLTPILEGARARAGASWAAMAAHARRTVVAESAKARDAGLAVGLENHQDFGSEELLAIADAAGDHVGLVLDTGNPFAVGEDPVACATRAAARIRHVHLKDYRAQFTPDGVRLVRCPIGDGCVPLTAIGAVLDAHGVSPTASLEPAALEARHIRCFTNDWWQGYGRRDAREFAQAQARLRERRLPDGADYRTPWERRAPDPEIVAYEASDLERSVRNMRALGWM